ncbi:uncharacterized protein PV09_09636 [Verruconis gallopava]|uniref:Uncharacterized protein n=1 Tax=Verruconis gallopava TaxID=253628 RepID=A0A0D1ZVV0_9PEZI|nr:uncharacterized protein PV09_09636 [Verruconis gallopava]KIV98572.1 hypothetical protein PV09_09636 [Verruconis gallopava]
MDLFCNSQLARIPDTPEMLFLPIRPSIPQPTSLNHSHTQPFQNEHCEKSRPSVLLHNQPVRKIAVDFKLRTRYEGSRAYPAKGLCEGQNACFFRLCLRNASPEVRVSLPNSVHFSLQERDERFGKNGRPGTTQDYARLYSVISPLIYYAYR